MKTIRLHPTRRRVYELLVDGISHNVGYTPASIAKIIKAEGGPSKARIYQIIGDLEAEGIVRPIPGMKRDKLYTRGVRSAILDDFIEAASQPLVNPPNGGVPFAQTLVNPPAEACILTAEAHVNGRYIYPVLRVGELYEPFRVRDERGEVSECVVWAAEPTQLTGVQYYTGRVPIHGGINIQYWDSQTSPAVHIWPTPVELLPGHVADAESDLAAKAQDVANWLGRFGGWRLGVPRYSSNEDGPGIHYACNDPAVVGNVPEGIKGFVSADTWIDSTPPPRAVETTDAERMDAMINYAAIARDLKQGQQAIGQDVAALEAAIERRQVEALQHRYDALGKQSELWQAIGDMSEIQLRTIHAQTIQAHIGGQGPGPSDPATASTTDADADARKGGMYQ